MVKLDALAEIGKIVISQPNIPEQDLDIQKRQPI
jgi:hypothetical protein